MSNNTHDSTNSNNTIIFGQNTTTTTANESIKDTFGAASDGTGRYQYTPCGYCDALCVYYGIQTCFTIGVIANAIVVLRVSQDKQLRNPTFVSIAACALADMCFLILNISRAFDSVILTITCDYPVKVFGSAFLILKSIFWFSANGHVALLAVLRYICLTFPLKANAYLSIRRVIMMSGCVWLLGLILMGVLTGLIFFTGFSGGRSREFNLVFWTVTYLMPLVTTVTLHLVKIYNVKKMTSETATENTKRLLKTMSKMVIMVVVFATALPFPYILDKCLRSFYVDPYGSDDLALHVAGISNLLVFFNHSVNPIMYAFVSEPFRMSLKRMLQIDQKAAEDSMMTSTTSVSEIQKREMILQKMSE